MGVSQGVDDGDVQQVVLPMEGDKKVGTFVVIPKVGRLQLGEASCAMNVVSQEVANTIVPLLQGGASYASGASQPVPRVLMLFDSELVQWKCQPASSHNKAECSSPVSSEG